MSSKMFRLKLNLLQCLICLSLFWPAIVYSFPSSNLALNDRYERDTSETVFTTGELDLVLQNDDLQFEICCKKDANDPNSRNCKQGSFLFCFPTTHQKQIDEGRFGCGAGTCSYSLKYRSYNNYALAFGSFTTSDECFKGKIDNEHIYAIYTNDEQEISVDNIGCPLDIVQPGNRLMLDIKTIPDGVTVKALNAHKYVEPTTLPPTITPLPTEEPAEDETTKKEPSEAGATTPETGMSDALKFSLMGVGIFVFLLVVGGIGFAIYWFCCKKKKSQKRAPPVTVATTSAADATPATKEAAPHVNDKTFEPKQKTTTENETTKDVEHSKQVASNFRSKNAAAPSNVVSSSAAAAEIPPPPPGASKDTSKEPNNNSEYSKTDASKLNKTDDQSPFDNDESGRGGKSASKKSHGQTSFSKEVAAALDKTKIKKKKATK